jgi:hypothetical protein
VSYTLLTKDRRNWIVRVYSSQAATEPYEKWLIENRTEHEADAEASADIARQHPDADWTMTPEDEE